MTTGRPVLEITRLRKEFRIPRGTTPASEPGTAAGVPEPAARAAPAARTVRAVSDLDLTVGSGETVGLVGESGSGKTTVARCVLRLTDPDAGRIVLDGTDITRLGPGALRPHRPKMHMVFQDPYSALTPHMTVADIVAAPLRAQRAVSGQHARGTSGKDTVRARVDEILAQVGLDPAALRGRRPHELSGGQRQRVGLARSLVVRPLLLVADEPTSALDVSVQASILNLLADLQRELGFSCLLISHDLAVVEYLCDRIAVMRHGEIVESGSREQILGDASHPYTRELLSARLAPVIAPGEPG